MEKIIIHTDLDLTPAGKRRVKIIRHTIGGKRIKPFIAWYVGNQRYASFALTNHHIELSQQWVSA